MDKRQVLENLSKVLEKTSYALQYLACSGEEPSMYERNFTALMIRQALPFCDAVIAELEHVDTKPTTLDPALEPYYSACEIEGYDTVLGYLVKNNPEALGLMSDPVFDTQRDGYWCVARCNKKGFEIKKVPAPAALQDIGIDLVNAYPLEVLEERLG